MNIKITTATPILILNIILLLLINWRIPDIVNSQRATTSICTCVTSSSSIVSSMTSSSTTSQTQSSENSSIANPSSSQLGLDEKFRQDHNNILDKDLLDLTIDDEDDILDAIDEYERLDQDTKDKLIDEKNHLDNLLNELNRLKSRDKINNKKTTVLDAETNGHFQNIPVCENDYIPELTSKIQTLLNDETISVNVALINDPKYEVEIIDDETLEAIAFEITATFTPCPGFQDRRDAQNTKAEIEQLLADGYFLNLIVPNLNTTNMKAAVLARVADLAAEYGTTITIINDTRSGSTYNFTFVIAKGDYEVSFNATATFTVG